MTRAAAQIAVLSAALAAALLAAQPAAAAPDSIAATPPSNVSACYEIAWGGIGFADLSLTVTADRGFRARTLIQTFGLVDLFGAFHYDATSDGRLIDSDLALPGQYVVLDGDKADKLERIALDFDPNSGAVAQQVTPPRHKERVEPALRTGAVDPLTALLQARGAIRRSLLGGPPNVIVPIYDGSKRYDLELMVLGHVRQTIGGTDWPLIHATARLKPIAGFRPRQLEHVQDPAELYLSDDAYLLPVRAESGWSSLTLVNRRTDGRPCRS
ncbi:MAG: DUF3108 domain-containing protein [Candidatus Eiseniibacteriota bacterium]